MRHPPRPVVTAGKESPEPNLQTRDAGLCTGGIQPLSVGATRIGEADRRGNQGTCQPLPLPVSHGSWESDRRVAWVHRMARAHVYVDPVIAEVDSLFTESLYREVVEEFRVERDLHLYSSTHRPDVPGHGPNAVGNDPKRERGPVS